jgi:molecular chaperone Hsp33
MPFAAEETIARLEKNLQDISSVTTMLDQGCGPEDVLRRVLDGFDLTITQKQEVRFSCSCSRDRVRKALISIGRKELESIIRDGKETELKCHFCNTAYHFSVDEIKALLKECR